ncbi:hypothetical protein MRBLBA21_004582 [Peribacillus frigoritolerans]|uniref:hypothetical protein n=1 Tax=Peribacillus frigoritolerans TaxID=450367 RepID=UPI00215B7234|nr:hypothetical protein [Peribacillus frigoritolerans]MCR8869447.1 hypothetical protein [Peribacillus frigoritolerans]
MGSIKIFKKVGLELVFETPAGKALPRGVPTGTKAPGADRPRKASAWREMNVRNLQISNPS